MKKIINVIVVSFILVLLCNVSITSKDEKQEIYSEIKTQSIVKLQSKIDKILNDKGLKRTKIGVAVYSIDEHQFLYKKNIKALFTPASTTKLFTAFTALYLMGEGYKIRTSLYTDGEIKDSIITGNLYIYGRGDALFNSEDLKLLVQQVYDKGIRVIEGDIIADGSYFDNKTERTEYSTDKDQVQALPPITALTLDRNTITIFVDGNSTDRHPNVYTIPHSESIFIDNNVRLSALETNFHKEDKFKTTKLKYDLNRVGDYESNSRRGRRSVRIISSKFPDGRQKFTLRGRISKGRKYQYSYFSLEPLIMTAGAVKYHLENIGIQVDGAYKVGTVPDAVLKNNDLAHFERLLTDVIWQTNKESDNFLAENIFKIIGAYAGEHNENSKKTRAIQSIVFKNLGIKCEGCKLNDGSGLSRRNLVTPEALITLLTKAQYLPFDNFFAYCLPIAGYDGTLKDRMLNSYAEFNLTAKTGTLRNVSALSGYVSSNDGELLAFAFLFNGPYVYNYKLTEDKLGMLLGSFYYGF